MLFFLFRPHRLHHWSCFVLLARFYLLILYIVFNILQVVIVCGGGVVVIVGGVVCKGDLETGYGKRADEGFDHRWHGGGGW